MLTETQFSSRTERKETLCLGIVCIAEYGRLDIALKQLQDHGEVSLGLPQGNRIPACVFTLRGQDKELLAELESLEAIMTIEVAYAQTIEEDEVQ